MKAMILCAGFGTRLGELTNSVPKPMLMLEGHPILEFIIVNLARHDFKQLCINLHFMPDMIKDYFGNGDKWNVEIEYSYEPFLLGTAGAVKKMSKCVNEEDLFLVHYGDILTNQNLTQLINYHRKKDAVATIQLHRRVGSNSSVTLDKSGRVISFIERPTKGKTEGAFSPLVNSGICICSPVFLESVPDIIPSDIPRDVFPKIIPTGRLYGLYVGGFRCAIDSPERLAEARNAVVSNRITLS